MNIQLSIQSANRLAINGMRNMNLTPKLPTKNGHCVDLSKVLDVHFMCCAHHFKGTAIRVDIIANAGPS